MEVESRGTAAASLGSSYDARRYVEDEVRSLASSHLEDADDEAEPQFSSEDERQYALTTDHEEDLEEIDTAADRPTPEASVFKVYQQRGSARELLPSDDESQDGEHDELDTTAQAKDVDAANAAPDNIDVWENLEQIFADMDAQDDSDENKLLLREPLAKLRRLLYIHRETITKAKALKKAHLGLLLERDWYMRKLRSIEDAMGPPIDPSEPVADRDQSSHRAFAGAVRSILYQDNTDFSLVGSKWPSGPASASS